MSTEDEYKRVYTGSEVNVLHLEDILQQEGIGTRVRNDFDSGLRAGFGGGLPGQVQLFVLSEQYELALNITRDTFPGDKL